MAVTKHSMSRTPVYQVYSAMIQRCCNEKNVSYHRYGGRGILVCDAWRYGDGQKSGFEIFYDDLGPRPSDNHTLERLDNNRGYEPGNCAWKTRREQSSNIRSNRKVMYDGREITLSELSRVTGVGRDTLSYRILKKGWSVDRAVTTPLQQGIRL